MSCISWVWGRTWSGKPVVSSQVSPRIVQVVEITKSAGLKWKSLSESEKSRTPAAAQRSAGSGGGGGGRFDAAGTAAKQGGWPVAQMMAQLVNSIEGDAKLG